MVEIERLVRVEHVWDTVVSMHLLGAAAQCRSAADAIVDWLHEVDEIFSTFDPRAAISRWHQGQLDVLPPELVEAVAVAREVETVTDGAFLLEWDGRPDPMGLVKGYAVERAVDIASRHGVRDLQVNAGGDVRVAGSRDPQTGEPWRLGIVNPFDAAEIVDVVSAHDLAMATSGNEHRGGHIRVQGTRRVVSATVVGPEGARADAYATALVATASLTSLMEQLDDSGWPSLVITQEGELHASPGWPGELHGSVSSAAPSRSRG